ncbi:MAG: hypothetical protein N2446_02355 [Elusimicrobiales bacterium]|nr:hypothetical protein [Elusimicrobiales bacterium]
MKIGLIGNPLKKSLSPLLYKVIYEVCNFKTDFYLLETQDLISTINKTIKDGFSGFFLTIPYKDKILNITVNDFLVDKTGSLNCVRIESKNLYATNTDYLALKKLIEKKSIDLNDKSITVLGRGATAKTVLALLLEKKVKKIDILVRDLDKKIEFKKHSENINFLDINKVSKIDSDLLINATPLGMYEKFPKIEINAKIVIDFAYLATDTYLVKYAKENEILFIEGKEILVMQSLLGLRHIFNKDLTNKFEEILCIFLKKSLGEV